MSLFSFLHKLGRALVQLPQSLQPTPAPRLIMTLLVKNEAELLEQHLRFHRAMGVDGFIITDNNSTDSTPDIIRHYQQKGWVLDVIEERGTGYAQKKWVDRMIELARTRHGADWIINADADEFWYAPSGNLKDELRTTSATVLTCALQNVYPETNRPFWEWETVVRPIPTAQQAAYDLSPYSIFGAQRPKVMHRASGYLQIAMGNHKVKILPSRQQASGIVIFHFNVRSQQQFIDKMVQGGRELEARKSKHGGRHWRYYYALYQEGEARLAAEYDRMIGRAALAQLQAEGYLATDTRLADYFRTHSELLLHD